MSNLLDIFNQLDDTRLALHKNLNAYDDDLKETYQYFKKESVKLYHMLDKLIRLDNLEQILKCKVDSYNRNNYVGNKSDLLADISSIESQIKNLKERK